MNMNGSNGPHPAGKSDLAMFRSGLKDEIPAGKLALTDNGYRGEPGKCSYKNPFDTPAVRRFKNRALARHETCNSRLKAFKILEDRFRTMGPTREGGPTREDKHKAVFVACAIIIQYQMENGRPLFAA